MKTEPQQHCRNSDLRIAVEEIKTVLTSQRCRWGRFFPKQVRKARGHISTRICLRDHPEIRLPLGARRNPPFVSQETLNAVSHAGQKELCQGSEKVEL